MRALIGAWLVCMGVAAASVAQAAPEGTAGEQYKLASQLDENGEYEKVLAAIDRGLASAPKDLKLLGLKGTVLLKLRDYAGALAAYQAYLDAGATGANRREAQKIIENLRVVVSTFLEIALANGPAEIYLDSKTQGPFCTAAPTCNRAAMPGEYKVIVERAGFETWSDRVTVESGRTTKLAVTLVEKPSLLTVRTTPPGARITVDGAAYEAPAAVAAGPHQVAASLAGHVEERLEVAAHEGKPIEVDLALVPLVPIRVEPAGAVLRLDDRPVAIQDGRIAIPPGVHALVGSAPGFRDRRIEIPAERGADYQLAMELSRIEVARTEAPPEVPRPAPGRGERRSELAAFALSALGTGVSLGLVLGSKSTGGVVTGALSSFVTPSLGHWYAGSYLTRGMVIRAVGVTTTLAGLALALSAVRSTDVDNTRGGLVAVGGLVGFVGVATYIVGTVDDILRAPGRMRSRNRQLRAAAIVPVVAPHAASLAIGGRF